MAAAGSGAGAEGAGPATDGRSCVRSEVRLREMPSQTARFGAQEGEGSEVRRPPCLSADGARRSQSFPPLILTATQG